MGDSLIGLVGKDFVLLAADRGSGRSIMNMKGDSDKIFKLDDHKAIAAGGPNGDVTEFTQYLQKNVLLNQFRRGIPMSTHGVANFTRTTLAEALRSQGAYQCNVLLGGVDVDKTSDNNNNNTPQPIPSLYFLDYLASCHKMNFACQGYTGYFCLSILDKYYKEGMNLEEALDVLNKCIAQMKLRFVLKSEFTIKIIDKDGIRQLSPQETKKGSDKMEIN